MPTAIFTSEEIPFAIKEKISALGILNEQESIQCFFCHELERPDQEMVFFTEYRIIDFSTQFDTEHPLIDFYFDEIYRIEWVEKEAIQANTIIRLTLEDGFHDLLIPSENGKEKDFFQSLYALWKKQYHFEQKLFEETRRIGEAFQKKNKSLIREFHYDFKANTFYFEMKDGFFITIGNPINHSIFNLLIKRIQSDPFKSNLSSWKDQILWLIDQFIPEENIQEISRCFLEDFDPLVAEEKKNDSGERIIGIPHLISSELLRYDHYVVFVSLDEHKFVDLSIYMKGNENQADKGLI